MRGRMKGKKVRRGEEGMGVYDGEEEVEEMKKDIVGEGRFVVKRGRGVEVYYVVKDGVGM